jgi:hypothetical protein
MMRTVASTKALTITVIVVGTMARTMAQLCPKPAAPMPAAPSLGQSLAALTQLVGTAAAAKPPAGRVLPCCPALW